VPLKQSKLRNTGIYTREVDTLSSTEFTFTRFLVPYLAGYQGWAVFVDCDFVFVDDVKKLFDQADDRYAVMVVKHDYTPKEGIKMDGCKQLPYPRKNWSSMILWNCGHASNQQVTPDLVNSQTGQYLHRFQWLNDAEIGNLDPEWNWLAGWYREPQDGTPKAIHYTEGGPWFKEYRQCEYHEVWKQNLREMLQ
jgi:lipopolysaccharide biosynthesis glycosyltransferase